jgi:glycerophosphoryl diester phosphodiesterase
MAPPLIVAHRLGRAGGPDSSRQALRRALAGPADGPETDVCLTADGQLALLHDPWLAIGTTAEGWAHRTRWTDVLELACLRDRDGVPTAEPVLRLEDLLDDAYVDQLRAGGLSVTTGTVNDPELARRVARLGVDAITSDDPARLAGAGLTPLAASR